MLDTNLQECYLVDFVELEKTVMTLAIIQYRYNIYKRKLV